MRFDLLALQGYTLSATGNPSFNWAFPSGTSIPANGFIIVYLTGRGVLIKCVFRCTAHPDCIFAILYVCLPLNQKIVYSLPLNQKVVLLAASCTTCCQAVAAVSKAEGRAGKGRTGQGRAGQGRAGRGGAGRGGAGRGRAGQGLVSHTQNVQNHLHTIPSWRFQSSGIKQRRVHLCAAFEVLINMPIQSPLVGQILCLHTSA